MKLFPVVTKHGTQGNLFIGVMDRGMSESEKERGTTLAEDALETWVWKADDWLSYLEPGSTFTADSLVENIGLPTFEDGRPNNNGVGGYIAGLVRRKRIAAAGYTTSDRVTNHGRVLRIWRIL